MIDGCWAIKFLTKIKFARFRVKGTPAMHPQLCFAILEIPPTRVDEFFGHVEKLEVGPDGRLHAQIFRATTKLFKVGSMAFYVNYVNDSFMRSTGSMFPIPRNQYEERIYAFKQLEALKVCQNKGKDTEFVPSISGPLTNATSVRSLEGCTDYRAYDKKFQIDTVSVATSLNHAYNTGCDNVKL